MFFLTYLRHELRRRMHQAILIAVGLAVGIGLVVTVTAASAGVENAQSTVLHALYGIGTDITVTKAPPPGSHAGGAFSPGSATQQVDELLNGQLGLLNASSVASIARLRSVAAAAGGLTLTDMKLTIPSAGSLGPGGQPPSSLPAPTSFTVDGVDLTHLGLGPFGTGSISAGRTFAAADGGSNVAVVDSNYATANKLTVGSTIVIAKTRFTVIGIVRQPQGGGSVDVYIPLARAQALGMGPGGSLRNQVNTIYVAAASASAVPTVQAEIAKLLPSATVTTSGSLASAVSGSLAAAASLISDFGRWLAIAVLITAFAVASLLTMAAVARRVREFGTLKALGWRSRRIIAQVMAESIVVGVVGAVMGIALGFGGAALVDAVAPPLSATVAQNPGSAPAQDALLNGGGVQHQLAPGSTSTIIVHLAAQVTANALVLAVALAIAGALIAGAFGSWRAARLRPAVALAQVA